MVGVVIRPDNGDRPVSVGSRRYCSHWLSAGGWAQTANWQL